ncbi:MAG: dihydroorotase [Ignavibacteriales bacterium]|nr:dihydroorotase [Ignavibacteriales bacterium]
MTIHLKHGRLIDPVSGKDETVDILIRDGRIEKLGGQITSEKSAQDLDLKGKIVAPGFIDMHVHLREPGFEHKETIETGCASAAAGGFTAVCCMPNTNPVIDDESVVRYVIERGRRVCDGIVDVYPIAAATRGRKGEELAPMAELVGAGAVGFSDDGSPISSAEIMRRAFEYSSMYKRPVIQHAEEETLTQGGVMHEGFVSTRLGMPGIPGVAEEIMVQRDVALLKFIRTARYHVAHISTKEALACVRAAKKEGLHVTCEVTPHHFTLTDEAVSEFDTNTKMNPPLRTKDDLLAMKEGLRDGTIVAIATDHAPHTIDEKEVEYAAAPFGIVGLETAIGLAYTELVDAKYLSLFQLIEKLSTNPRRILSLAPIRIQEGEKANLTFLDPSIEWTVDTASFRSKSKNSPFQGRRLKGKAVGIYNNSKFFATSSL